MVYGIALLVLGLFSVYMVLMPQTKTEKLGEVQKYAGIAFAVLGLWGIIYCLLNLNLLTSGWMVGWITRIVVSVGLITLGVLSVLFGKLDKSMHLFVATMGIIAIGMGIWQIVAGIIW